ncbi:MAG TPA: hypothetical protein PKH77_27615 [Anaerolineae bacterium]|nr:hypothetical protein [Anaerolineae bacterium]
MEAVRIQQVMLEDGEVLLTGLPYKRGQQVEVIVLPYLRVAPPAPRMTVGRLRNSGLLGLWRDREDIADSSVYARDLREQAQPL